MKVRRWWVTVVGLIASVIIGLFFFILHEDGRDPIRYENYEKIHIGMSRTEVHEILGRNCGCEDGQIFISVCDGKRTDPNLEWEGHSNRITVTFLDGHVERKTIENTSIRNFIGAVKRRIGLAQSQTTFVTVGE